MLPPERRVIEAFARLSADVDFAAIMEWIAASRQDNFYSLEVAPATDVSRYQGYGQALGDIIKHSKQARSALVKTGSA